MHTFDIKEINKRFNIPENLSECDRRQYLDMAKLIFMFQNEEITYEQFRILALVVNCFHFSVSLRYNTTVFPD